jgi:hypothetical protein
MVVRIARVLSTGVTLVLLAVVPSIVCADWSLPNPFSSESKTAAKSKKYASRTVNKEPSALDKVGTGTKKFFSQAGESLGLKKAEPKKLTSAIPRRPELHPQQKESKSWLPSWLQSEEPKKDKTVSEWMKNKRLDP